MKIKVLPAILTLLIACLQFSFIDGMLAHTDAQVHVCILCTRHFHLLSLANHYEVTHKLKSRFIYLCNQCNHAGSAREIRTHIIEMHYQKIISARHLRHIRIPHLPKDPRITPARMQNYSKRLYALLDEAETLAEPVLRDNSFPFIVYTGNK